MHNAHSKLHANSQPDVFCRWLQCWLVVKLHATRIILLSHFAGFVWVTNVHSLVPLSSAPHQSGLWCPGLSQAHARRHTHNTPTLHICHSVPCTTLHIRHTQGLVSTYSNQQQSLRGWPCCFLGNAAGIKTTPSRSWKGA